VGCVHLFASRLPVTCCLAVVALAASLAVAQRNWRYLDVARFAGGDTLGFLTPPTSTSVLSFADNAIAGTRGAEVCRGPTLAEALGTQHRFQGSAIQCGGFQVLSASGCSHPAVRLRL
jgi:hypothetical protein